MTSEKVIPALTGIVTLALGSLVAYVFYGFIGLSAEVKTLHPVINQMKSEQDDLWSKYNQDQNDKVSFIKDYYQFKVDEEKRWVEFYKEKQQYEIRR